MQYTTFIRNVTQIGDQVSGRILNIVLLIKLMEMLGSGHHVAIVIIMMETSYIICVAWLPIM